jgi:hypothetical protein
MQRKELPEPDEHWVRVGRRMSRFLYALGYETMSISPAREPTTPDIKVNVPTKAVSDETVAKALTRLATVPDGASGH